MDILLWFHPHETSCHIPAKEDNYSISTQTRRDSQPFQQLKIREWKHNKNSEERSLDVVCLDDLRSPLVKPKPEAASVNPATKKRTASLTKIKHKLSQAMDKAINQIRSRTRSKRDSTASAHVGRSEGAEETGEELILGRNLVESPVPTHTTIEAMATGRQSTVSRQFVGVVQVTTTTDVVRRFVSALLPRQ